MSEYYKQEYAIINSFIESLKSMKTMDYDGSDQFILNWAMYNLACAEFLEKLLDCPTYDFRNEGIDKVIKALEEAKIKLSGNMPTPVGQA